MTDERIQTTFDRFAARGYHILYLLMLISLGYRSLILKQHIRDFWDILAILSIATLFVLIACASKGVFDHGFKRTWLGICIGGFIGMLTVGIITGQIHSVVDVGGLLIGSLIGFGTVIAIAYFLNRRWKRKAGIDDEE